MPNHITSEVEISGTKEQITDLVQRTKLVLDTELEGNEFDFNGIVPMPEDSETFLAKGGLGQAEREKYGDNNWYDWAIANWGTKWNAYDVHLTKYDDEKVVLSLTTAWSSPWPIWKALEEQGYTVKGVVHGEMEGYEYIGDGQDVFEAHEHIEIEYYG